MDGLKTPKRINDDGPNLMLKKQTIHIRRIFVTTKWKDQEIHTQRTRNIARGKNLMPSVDKSSAICKRNNVINEMLQMFQLVIMSDVAQ
jgi:hypothetical protein